MPTSPSTSRRTILLRSRRKYAAARLELKTVFETTASRQPANVFVRVIRTGQPVKELMLRTIAQETGLTEGGVSRIFSGSRRGSTDSIILIADALGVSPITLSAFLEKRRKAAAPSASARIAG